MIEAVLNHAIPGVAGKYNYATYLLEKRAALVRWGAHVARLVAQPVERKPARRTKPAANGAGLVQRAP